MYGWDEYEIFQYIIFRQLRPKEANNLKELLRLDLCQKQCYLENVKVSIYLIMLIEIFYDYSIEGDGEYGKSRGGREAREREGEGRGGGCGSFFEKV